MFPLPGMYPTPTAKPQSADVKQARPPSPTQIYPEEPLEENKVLAHGIQQLLYSSLLFQKTVLRVSHGKKIFRGNAMHLRCLLPIS